MKYGVFLLTFLVAAQCAFAQANAGPDKASCSGGNGVEIGAMSNDPNLCYSWSAVPADPSVANLKTPKITVKPATTTTYTLTVVGPAFSSKSTDDVKVYAVKTTLQTAEYKSDHNKICNGTGLFSGGSRYPTVEWDKNVAVKAPLTHTAKDNLKISLQLKIDIEGLGNSVPFAIVGTSAEPALNFRSSGNTAGGTGTVFDLTATNAIGKEIRKIDNAITWSITFLENELPENKCELGTTQNVIYTTLGTPEDSDPAAVPNIPRMELSVPKIATAIAAAGSYTCYPKIVWEFSKANGAYNLALNLQNRINAWQLPSTPNGADCISIAWFVANVCEVIGIPGTFDSKTFMGYYRIASNPNRPKVSVEGSLNNPAILPGSKGTPLTAGLGANWILALADVNCAGSYSGNAGDEGCSGGLNAFEAAVIYVYGGNTYYFPGGTDLIYDNVNKVVQIFQTMAWCNTEDHDGNPATPDRLIVKKVDFKYPPAPANDIPVCN
jgi:hypothetical protein